MLALIARMRVCSAILATVASAFSTCPALPRSSRVAFVHPKSSGGVLTEIVQPAEAH